MSVPSKFLLSVVSLLTKVVTVTEVTGSDVKFTHDKSNFSLTMNDTSDYGVHSSFILRSIGPVVNFDFINVSSMCMEFACGLVCWHIDGGSYGTGKLLQKLVDIDCLSLDDFVLVTSHARRTCEEYLHLDLVMSHVVKLFPPVYNAKWKRGEFFRGHEIMLPDNKSLLVINNVPGAYGKQHSVSIIPPGRRVDSVDSLNVIEVNHMDKISDITDRICARVDQIDADLAGRRNDSTFCRQFILGLLNIFSGWMVDDLGDSVGITHGKSYFTVTPNDSFRGLMLNLRGGGNCVLNIGPMFNADGKANYGKLYNLLEKEMRILLDETSPPPNNKPTNSADERNFSGSSEDYANQSLLTMLCLVGVALRDSGWRVDERGDCIGIAHGCSNYFILVPGKFPEFVLNLRGSDETESMWRRLDIAGMTYDNVRALVVREMDSMVKDSKQTLLAEVCDCLRKASFDVNLRLPGPGYTLHGFHKWQQYILKSDSAIPHLIELHRTWCKHAPHIINGAGLTPSQFAHKINDFMLNESFNTLDSSSTGQLPLVQGGVDINDLCFVATVSQRG